MSLPGGPLLIQRRNSAICWAVSFFVESAGGIRVSSSVAETRIASTTSLFNLARHDGLPRPTRAPAGAPSCLSSRKPASRCPASGPWQA